MNLRLIHCPCFKLACLLVAAHSIVRAEDAGQPSPTPSQIEGFRSARNDPFQEVGAHAESIYATEFGDRSPARIKTANDQGNSKAGSDKNDYGYWAKVLSVRNPREALEHLSTAEAREFAPQVKQLLRPKSPADIEDVFRTLDRMGVADYAPELKELVKSGEPYVRERAARKLCELGDPEGWDAVFGLLSDPESKWGRLFDFPSGRSLTSGQLDQIAGLLTHPEAAIRIRALEVIPESEGYRYADAIQALLTPDQLDSVILAALHYHKRVAVADITDRLPDLLRTVSVQSTQQLLDSLEYPQNINAAPAVAEFLLAEQRPGIIVKALGALGKLRAGRFAGIAGRFLSREYPENVRYQAIETIGELGGGGVPWSGEIAKMLENPGQERPVPFAELEALERLHAVDQSGPIRRAMEKSGNDYFRMRCAMTLYHFGSISLKEASRITGGMLRVSGSREADGQKEVEETAKELIRDGSLEALEDFLAYIGKGTRRWHWPVEHTFSPCRSWLGPREIAGFLESPDALVRAGALKVLSEQGDYEFPGRVEKLFAGEEVPTVIPEALTYLIKADKEAAERQAISLLAADMPDEVQTAALGVLQQTTNPKAVPVLASLIERGKPGSIRDTAILILARMNAPGTMTLLTPLLNREESWSIRGNIFEALRREKPPDAVPVLRSLLAGKDTDLRREACQYFILLSNGENAAEVKELLNDGNPIVRESAVKALESTPELAASYRREIETLLTKPEPRARYEGIGLLSRAGIADSLPAAQKLLIDPDDFVVHCMARALAETKTPGPLNLYPQVVEAAHVKPRQRVDILCAAHLLYAALPEVRPLLNWLGNRTPTERPEMPQDAFAARELIEHLRDFGINARRQNCPHATIEASALMAKLVTGAHWTPSDADWLFGLAEEMQKYPGLEGKAAEVRTLAQREYDRQPLRIALRLGLMALALQPVFWLLVLLLYPYWSFAQRLVWQPLARKVAGLGWVGPLLVRVPALRAWLWRPFREALVPPAEVQTFDEWTFFDSVRIRKAGSAEDSLPALPALQRLTGSAVLQGVSGLGKTTLLQALVASASTHVAFLRAADCREGFLTTLRHRLPKHARNDPDFLRVLIQRGSPAIFIDAVHEAPPAVQAQLTQEIDAFKGGRFILTAQPVAWHPPQDATVWEIEPLRPQDIAAFLLKQGTAAIEAAGSHALPDKWEDFKARVESFLDELKDRPLDDPRAEAIRRMLRNPMEAVLAAELLAAGEIPEPSRLLAQRLEHFTEDYSTQYDVPFPSTDFATHLVTWRLTGAPLISMTDFENVADFLAKHRLLRKHQDGDGWRFRHDKIADWFLAPAFADAGDPVFRELKSDVRFAGIGVAAM